MKGVRKTTKEYNEMLNDIAEVNLSCEGKCNCYTCRECGDITKSVDVAKGVTPFMIKCKKCGSFAHSSFYNDISPNQEPTIH